MLLLICVVSLLTTVGCIFPGHQGGADYQYLGHGEYREHSEYPGYAEPGVSVRIHAD
jgi:hypothetical protein